MTQEYAAGSTPVVRDGNVRFALFDQTRGLLLYEISSRALIECFGATSDAPEALLSAYEKHMAAIHEVALRTYDNTVLTLLGTPDFSAK